MILAILNSSGDKAISISDPEIPGLIIQIAKVRGCSASKVFDEFLRQHKDELWEELDSARRRISDIQGQ